MRTGLQNVHRLNPPRFPLRRGIGQTVTCYDVNNNVVPCNSPNVAYSSGGGYAPAADVGTSEVSVSYSTLNPAVLLPGQPSTQNLSPAAQQVLAQTGVLPVPCSAQANALSIPCTSETVAYLEQLGITPPAGSPAAAQPAQPAQTTGAGSGVTAQQAGTTPAPASTNVIVAGQVPAPTTSTGFDLSSITTWLTGTVIDSIPNWVLLAGGAALVWWLMSRGRR